MLQRSCADCDSVVTMPILVQSCKACSHPLQTNILFCSRPASDSLVVLQLTETERILEKVQRMTAETHTINVRTNRTNWRICHEMLLRGSLKNHIVTVSAFLAEVKRVSMPSY